jgi:NADH:ubiquinone reductase (H+-translocating)
MSRYPFASQGCRCRCRIAISFDSLIIATGSRTSYFGHDDWQSVAPGLKTPEDATLIRRRLLLAFERAELESDGDARAALLTIAVFGGGPTGVQLAGIIAELSRETLRGEFRRIDTRSTRVLLIEAGPRLLSAFPHTLSTYATRSPQRRGVEVHLGTAVRDVTENGIRLGDSFISCCTVVWAAGVTASPVGDWLDIKTGNDRCVPVTSDLAVVSHPHIFVIGDAAAVVDTSGALVPQLAPAAKQQGAHVAKVIAARLSRKPPPPAFRYRHAGNLATIGKRSAVVQFGRIELTGGLAWWIWGIAHIYFLIGTRNRVAVAWDWLWTYLRGLSAARLITDPLPPKSDDG